MHVLYNILAVILVVLATPAFIMRLIREKGFGQRLAQSFGFLPNEDVELVAKKDCIWLHAASVGEIVAASPIIKEMRRTFPNKPVLVSVVTATGYAMAKRIITDADSIIFFPLDLPLISYGVVKRIRPSVFLMVETELWPNFLRAMSHFSIPVMMVNGRISDKSVERYRYLGSILKGMLDTVDKFCMQSTIDAQYVIRLGANPNRVVVTGNTKFDQNYTSVTVEEKNILFKQMGFAETFPVLVAGSTHKGEEEILLTALKKIKKRFPNTKVIIAPRDIMRVDELIELASSFGFLALRRTELLKINNNNHDIVLLDTIGELGKIYSVGTIVYVGGSLVAHGGHNILEPAAHGKPILVGPHMFNFKDTYALFSKREACMTVTDETTLTEKIVYILDHEEVRLQMSRETLKIIEENGGAARNSMIYLQEILQ
ncbi:3-deoxy-D-manno-octulosonic acid transferase [Pelosinus sp. sgz500959]|uniref:3-deoxy-D-manno-octulosonic acid transferase n=1 Tax=Pelosinus sp. sgz500959 TaxID=3242472 RepID=UPI00366BF138